MSKDMIIELTETSLQFIDLPDTYDEDIRENTFILKKHGWVVHSCSVPQVGYSDSSLFLPGSYDHRDRLMCHFPESTKTYCIILSLLHEVCKKFGYSLINRRQERTVTL